jgi:hypothetical protein
MARKWSRRSSAPGKAIPCFDNVAVDDPDVPRSGKLNDVAALQAHPGEL